jgi:4'-phosphopantetheinyl transferase
VLWSPHPVNADPSTLRQEFARLVAQILPTSTWLLRRDHRGKPYLDGSDDHHVSLARSAGVMLVAVSRGAKVGVDVERRCDRGLRALPTHALGKSERLALDRIPVTARAEAFLTCWVRKEAILKAEGVGLGVEPRRIEVSAPDEPAAVQRVPDGIGPASAWTLADLDVPGCAAAVAVRQPLATVRLMRAEGAT